MKTDAALNAATASAIPACPWSRRFARHLFSACWIPSAWTGMRGCKTKIEKMECC